MDASRLRVEFIRFALLITVTVALVSVATRAGHHDKANRASPNPSPSASASQPSATGGSNPAGGTTGSTGHGHAPGSNSGDSNSGGTPGGATGASSQSGGGVAGTETLPRTGSGAGTAELAALAFILIAAGGWTVTASRPETRV